VRGAVKAIGGSVLFSC